MKSIRASIITTSRAIAHWKSWKLDCSSTSEVIRWLKMKSIVVICFLVSVCGALEFKQVKRDFLEWRVNQGWIVIKVIISCSFSFKAKFQQSLRRRGGHSSRVQRVHKYKVNGWGVESEIWVGWSELQSYREQVCWFEWGRTFENRFWISSDPKWCCWSISEHHHTRNVPTWSTVDRLAREEWSDASQRSKFLLQLLLGVFRDRRARIAIID